MKKERIIPFIMLVGLPLVLGILSSLLAGDLAQKYGEFTLPPLSPPGWLFGVVWPILYILMGISSYLIYLEPPSQERNRCLLVYFVQLFINFIWSPIFFGVEFLGLAVAVIIILDMLVLYCIITFRKVRPLAGNLLIPYILWIAFATYLCAGVALLN